MTDASRGSGDLVGFVAAAEPLIRRLKRTESMQKALDELIRLATQGDSWDGVRESNIRLACLRIVVAYVDEFVGLSGNGRNIQDVFSAQRVLRTLLFRMSNDRIAIERLTEVAGEAGIELDPSKRGGGLLRSGTPGSPSTVLRACVEDLLRRRCPDWDGESAFPEKNTAELREWIRSNLIRPPSLEAPWTSGVPWAVARRTHPFRPEDIESKNRGPIWAIVNSLKNPSAAS